MASGTCRGWHAGSFSASHDCDGHAHAKVAPAGQYCALQANAIAARPPVNSPSVRSPWPLFLSCRKIERPVSAPGCRKCRAAYRRLHSSWSPAEFDHRRGLQSSRAGHRSHGSARTSAAHLAHQQTAAPAHGQSMCLSVCVRVFVCVCVDVCARVGGWVCRQSGSVGGTGPGTRRRTQNKERGERERERETEREAWQQGQ